MITRHNLVALLLRCCPNEAAEAGMDSSIEDDSCVSYLL